MLASALFLFFFPYIRLAGPGRLFVSSQRRWILALRLLLPRRPHTAVVGGGRCYAKAVGSEGGNTFFNTLIFGKRLSRASPLLSDLRGGVE